MKFTKKPQVYLCSLLVGIGMMAPIHRLTNFVLSKEQAGVYHPVRYDELNNNWFNIGYSKMYEVPIREGDTIYDYLNSEKRTGEEKYGFVTNAILRRINLFEFDEKMNIPANRTLILYDFDNNSLFFGQWKTVEKEDGTLEEVLVNGRIGRKLTRQEIKDIIYEKLGLGKEIPLKKKGALVMYH